MEAVLELPGQFLSVSFPIVCVGALYLCASSITLMRREGFSFSNALGMLFGLFNVLVFLEIKYISSISASYSSLRNGACFFFEILLCEAWCFLAVGCLAGYFCAKRGAAYDKDYLIILGCSISKDGGLRPLLKARINRGIRFAWDQERATGKSALYVPSGGQGADEVMSEGSAMELYIIAHGAEFDEVFPEKRSRNTFENLVFSKRIIDQRDPDAKVAFVTSDYHILRSGLLARRAGLEAEGISSKTVWYFAANGFVRELIAISVMYKWIFLLLTAMDLVFCAFVF